MRQAVFSIPSSRSRTILSPHSSAPHPLPIRGTGYRRGFTGSGWRWRAPGRHALPSESPSAALCLLNGVAGQAAPIREATARLSRSPSHTA